MRNRHCAHRIYGRYVRFLAALADTRAANKLAQQLRDGAVSRLILIAVDGGTPAALAKRTKTPIRAELHKHPAEFAAVNNGEDSALDLDREFLWRNRYLLSPAVAPGHFSAPALRDALEEDLQLIGSPAGALVAPYPAARPHRRVVAANCAIRRRQRRPEVREGVWFSPDGSRALLARANPRRRI